MANDNFFGIEGSPVQTRPNWKQQIKDHLNKYGWVALILLFFTGWNGFIIWNAEKFIERADKQADGNLRIGNLEGKLDILLEDRKELLKYYQDKTATNSAIHP